MKALPRLPYIGIVECALVAARDGAQHVALARLHLQAPPSKLSSVPLINLPSLRVLCISTLFAWNFASGVGAWVRSLSQLQLVRQIPSAPPSCALSVGLQLRCDHPICFMDIHS